MTDALSVAMVLGSSTGGVGAHVRSLVPRLVALGVSVHVLAPLATEAVFDWTGAGATLTPVEISTRPQPRVDRATVATLRSTIAAGAVVHAHGLRAGALARRSGRRPLVVSWHNAVLGSRARRALLAQLERYVARGADVTLAASEDLASRARTLGARDVRLAPVAAPAPRVERSRDEVRAELGVGTRSLIVCVARLHQQKGVDVLLDAVAPWRARDDVLVVVAGDGPEESALSARVDAARLPVRLLGRRSDVADLLAACDLAVLPSRWDARSLAAQEALLVGAPLVATRVGGLPDLLPAGTAVLVAPEDPRALREAMESLLADAPARELLSTTGRDHAASWPDEDDTAEQCLAVYRSLARRA